MYNPQLNFEHQNNVENYGEYDYWDSDENLDEEER